MNQCFPRSLNSGAFPQGQAHATPLRQSLSIFQSELFTGKEFVGFLVDTDGLIDNVLRYGVSGMSFQVIADKLLVIGRLAMTCFVTLSRPEAGIIRSQHFIAQNDISFLVQTEFKLCICNDNASFQSIVSALVVKGKGQFRQFFMYSLPFPGKNLFTHASPSSMEIFWSCSPTGALVEGVKIG